MTTNLIAIVLWTVTTNWTEPSVITPSSELWTHEYESERDSRIKYSETGIVSSNEVLCVIFKGKTNEVSKTEKQFKMIVRHFHWEPTKIEDDKREELFKKDTVFLSDPMRGETIFPIKKWNRITTRPTGFNFGDDMVRAAIIEKSEDSVTNMMTIPCKPHRKTYPY